MTRSRAVALSLGCLGLAAAICTAPRPAAAQLPALTQPSGAALQISWEVRNRFRLFREERDFLLHAEALAGRSILAAEQALAVRSDGRGWARNIVGRLCIDPTGRVTEPCVRDNVKESYLTPTDHAVTLRLAGTVPVGAVCAWTISDADPPRRSTLDSNEPINMRVPYGRATPVSVEGPSAEGTRRP